MTGSSEPSRPGSVTPSGAGIPQEILDERLARRLARPDADVRVVLEVHDEDYIRRLSTKKNPAEILKANGFKIYSEADKRKELLGVFHDGLVFKETTKWFRQLKDSGIAAEHKRMDDVLRATREEVFEGKPLIDVVRAGDVLISQEEGFQAARRERNGDPQKRLKIEEIYMRRLRAIGLALDRPDVPEGQKVPDSHYRPAEAEFSHELGLAGLIRMVMQAPGERGVQKKNRRDREDAQHRKQFFTRLAREISPNLAAIPSLIKEMDVLSNAISNARDTGQCDVRFADNIIAHMEERERAEPGEKHRALIVVGGAHGESTREGALHIQLEKKLQAGKKIEVLWPVTKDNVDDFLLSYTVARKGKILNEGIVVYDVVQDKDIPVLQWLDTMQTKRQELYPHLTPKPARAP